MPKRTAPAPEFVRFIGPVIQALAALGGSGRPEEVRAAIAKALRISDDEQAAPLPSGVQTRFENQVHWARFYLAKGGYIDGSRHGVWTLTEKARGLGQVSSAQAREIYRTVAMQFGKSRDKGPVAELGQAAEERVAPITEAEHTLVSHQETVAARLLGLPPAGFERFCQRLLRESGFEEVAVTGRSGDGGIDGMGILQVNPLVSFKVLFQCKRYSGSVTPSQVRDFRGAMMGRADKGIIITTGSFTSEARKEAVRDGVPAIELVDGEKLISMLEQLELGLEPQRTFEVDGAFFDQFQD
ncbi:MAG: restriction endonuclease [Vicinamibacterales bacterium]|nr:restriction endonuclease [Vicinamibacterales bacterium]